MSDTPPLKKAKSDHATTAATAITPAATKSTFRLLHLLPPPLLALVASHLPVVSLLRLQRCSSTQYRLRTDESYMAVAWSRAELLLETAARMHEWALPRSRAVAHRRCWQRQFIPVDMWRGAVRVFAVALGKGEFGRLGLTDRLRPYIAVFQPTR